MTIIEFFDNDFIENIASALLLNPDKVIFVGDDLDDMNAAKARFEEITARRGLKTKFFPQPVEKTSLSSIVSALTKIINENDDCHFDIEGGEDLYLVAVGIISERFGDKIGLHRYNIEMDKLNDCDMDGKPNRVFRGQINVNDNIEIYGGKVIYRDADPIDGTEDIEFTQDLFDDVSGMWDICKRNTGNWNFLMKDIANRATNINLSFIYLKTINNKDRAILRELSANGFIKNLRIAPQDVTFECKNETVKKCILKAGTLLELYIALACNGAKTACGERYFGDVKTGVFIDWDGKQTGNDVENEIDVLCTRGMIPYFISCKSGHVDSEELYKLTSVSDRFGGKYAQKILCVTDLEKHGIATDSIKSRAKDMGIKIIEKLDIKSFSDIQNELMI